MLMDLIVENLAAIDDKLSQRHIDLDPGGYFIIYLDRDAGLIYAKHFTNVRCRINLCQAFYKRD